MTALGAHRAPLQLKNELRRQLGATRVIELVRGIQVIDRAKVARTRSGSTAVTDAGNCRTLARRIDYWSGQQWMVESVDKLHSQLNLPGTFAIQMDVLP